MRRTIRFILAGILVLGVGGVTVAWRLEKGGEAAGQFRTTAVKRTDVVSAIGATGTVEPEEVVDIGAQVAGQIQEFGTDENGKAIDYGSAVEKGTVLARIDDSLYAADVATQKAALKQAQANEIAAEANVQQMQAKLTQAQRDWERAQKLGPSEALAPSAYDQYKSGYEIAQANLAVARAGVEQAKASQAEVQAALDRAERNLGYCTITSPVKGVIIDRRVNIGQTVVSSLNAPSLFLLAKDLRRVEVWVSVNEADIGRIHPGMPVTFTVDAFPNQVFHGQVGKVRLNATMSQNVVTYTVEVTTENADGRLLPYLTANVQFVTASREHVLAVPNEALRWNPQPEQVAPQYRSASRNTGRAAVEPGGADTSASAAGPEGTVWVEDGAYVKPVAVRAGLTDGLQTEVEGTGLDEGTRVVIGEQQPQNLAGASTSGASPFTPQFGRARSNAAQRTGGK